MLGGWGGVRGGVNILSIYRCLRGRFFEGFRVPREGFLKVFQNFRGRRRGFLGFFEGFLLALESLCLAVSANSFFPNFSFFFIFVRPFFFRFLFFYSFFYFWAQKSHEKSLKSQGDKKNYFFNIGPFSRGGLEKPNPARTIDTLADGS